jgi:hypothetical protein
MTTGGDVHADGGRVVIRNYATAYEFILPAGQPFDTIFQQSPDSYPLQEVQGEGICYTYFDGDLVTTSEASPKFRISAIDWQLANIRAEDVTNDSATIRWDTASPLDSRVDYGMTTAYGDSESDSSSVTAHALELSGLTTGQQYFYRVKSGSLQYPDAVYAPDFSFVAKLLLPSDFDEDGDVDLEDFGHLQQCLTGDGATQSKPSCMNARLDSDYDVDHDDMAILKGCMSGAGILFDPDCHP